VKANVLARVSCRINGCQSKAHKPWLRISEFTYQNRISHKRLYKHEMKVLILPSGSLQEPQPVHQAESLLPTTPMEEIAREIEQLQMQLKAKIKESETTIQDLEAENWVLKQKLFQEEEENKSASEKVQCCFLQLCVQPVGFCT